MNCTSLVNLDLGHNSLSGHIPIGVGDFLINLSSLSLRNNNFVGEIPLSLCRLSFLQILDLSTNHIAGTIPKCIYNLTAMQNGTALLPQFSYDTYRSFISLLTLVYGEEMIMWNRKEWSFINYDLRLLKAIDVSQNNLEGEIPLEISSLAGLLMLNLSRNHLHGNLTAIEELTSLLNLDLPHNHLSGEIPTSLADLTFLSTLDLSNNHLSGKIPNGPQLQTFDASSYAGNPELCGMPLPKCPGDHLPDDDAVNENNLSHQDETEIQDIFPGLYISVILGFIIGFWGVCGTLVLKSSWRHAFFRFFDDMKDKLYVMVSVNIARVRRRLKQAGDC